MKVFLLVVLDFDELAEFLLCFLYLLFESGEVEELLLEAEGFYLLGLFHEKNIR